MQSPLRRSFCENQIFQVVWLHVTMSPPGKPARSLKSVVLCNKHCRCKAFRFDNLGSAFVGQNITLGSGKSNLIKLWPSNVIHRFISEANIQHEACHIKNMILNIKNLQTFGSFSTFRHQEDSTSTHWDFSTSHHLPCAGFAQFSNF